MSAGNVSVARTLLRLIDDDDVAGLQELHDSGEWIDLDMDLQSDGETWFWSALAWAATNKQIEVMRVLIRMGADVNETRELHFPPSVESAGVGFDAGLELLKESGCNLSLGNSYGCTPVHAAAHRGHMSSLRLLHTWGLPMHTKDQCGGTPADHATENGHPECATFLIEEAMPIEDRIKDLIKVGDVDTMRRIHTEKKWTDMEMVMYSAKAPGGNTWHCSALALAAFNKQIHVMRLVIELGAEVNETRERHALPSLQAASVGFDEGLELLKEKGCDLAMGDSDGTTPVHIAASRGFIRIIRLLHGWSVPLQIVSKSGKTPAHLAAFEGRQNIIQQLHDWGEPLDQEDKEGRTPADGADNRGNKRCGDLVRRLVRQCSQDDDAVLPPPPQLGIP